MKVKVKIFPTTKMMNMMKLISSILLVVFGFVNAALQPGNADSGQM